MFQVLDSLFLPRVPQDSQTHTASNTVDPAPRRTVYLPKVTSGQRAILDFLQEDLRSGWRLALRLLAKYSIAAGDPQKDLDGEGRVVMEGAENPAGVTVECRKEATEALSAMMSDRLRVPPRERALAFEGLLSEVSEGFFSFSCLLNYSLCSVLYAKWSGSLVLYGELLAPRAVQI